MDPLMMAVLAAERLADRRGEHVVLTPVRSVRPAPAQPARATRVRPAGAPRPAVIGCRG